MNKFLKRKQLLNKRKMDLSKYMNAFKNSAQILEGIKNNVFKSEHIEEAAAQRWAICLNCPFLDKEGGSCLIKGTAPCCSKCGCSLKYKARALSSECPVGNWDALMHEEVEDTLKEKINYKEP